MIEFLFDFGPTIVPLYLVLLGYLGWWKRQKWARVVLIISLILLFGAAVLLGLYVYALGQANWSL